MMSAGIDRTSTFRIVVADPLELIAEGIRSWLKDGSEFEVVGHAATGQALLDLLDTCPCEIVLLEVTLDVKDGIDTMRAIHKHYPNLKVVAFSKLTEIEYVNSMLIEGASGYLVKGGTQTELMHALRLVLAGEQYLSEGAKASVQLGYSHTEKEFTGEYIGLSSRERDVIRLIAEERTNEEIADALFISAETVKSHRKSLMKKLNVRSTAGLVKYAIGRKWV